MWHRSSAIRCIALAAFAPALAQAQHFLALTNSGSQLIGFERAAPGTITSAVSVTGLGGVGETLIGIDFRPRTRTLYGLSRIGGTSDSLRLYRIDPATGAATPLGAAVTAVTASNLYGMDFNPTVDRLRIVNAADENLRLNPNTGARSDTPTNDTDLNPAGSQIDAIAYDRNVDGPAISANTTLYGISRSGNALVRIGGLNQSPSPNGGAVTSIGSLGATISAVNGVGFDIEGSAGAYAAFTDAGTNRTGLYALDLSSGAATLIGLIGNGLTGVTALAAEPPSNTLYFTTATNQLLRVDSSWPETVAATLPITGLVQGAGENVVGIDMRPATGELFVLGRTNSAGTNSLQTYRLNPQTGVASALGVPIASLSANSAYGIDFNPLSDRLRVVGSGDLNMRINPGTGARADVPTNDTALNPAGNLIEGVAYDRNIPGGSATTAYAISRQTSSLVSIGGIDGSPSPNGGALTTIGPVISGATISALGGVGFDIAQDGRRYAAFADSASGLVGLYAIDLTTPSQSVRIGFVGDGTTAISGLAVARSDRIFANGFQ